LQLLEKENDEQLKARLNNWKEELRNGTTLSELCFYSSRVAGVDLTCKFLKKNPELSRKNNMMKKKSLSDMKCKNGLC